MTVRVGSVDLGAAMVERVSMAEIPAVVVPQAEYLRRRLRGPNRIFRITHTFSGGSSDDDNIERLEGYVNTQAAIWMDWSDKWTELQAFGYLASSTMTYRWQNTREVEYTFLEIPAWGRLYVNSVSGYQLHSMDGSDGWTGSVSGGAAPLSLVTSGMKEGYGCVRMTAAAVTSWAKMYYALPRAVDMRQYDGFTFWLRVSSVTNLAHVLLHMSTEVGMTNYYTKDWTMIPRKTGSWYQFGVTRDDMTATGSPDWSKITHMWLEIQATGGGSNYTGTVDWDDLKLVGVGENVKIYDLDYASLGTAGYQKAGVQDILSPLWGRYGWTLDRTNKKWQQDFYLVNEALKHVPTTIDDCEATTDWTANGTGAGMSVSLNTTLFKEGSASIQWTGTLDQNEYVYAQYNPSTLINLSQADFLSFYIKSLLPEVVGTYKVRITDNAGAWREYVVTVPANAYRRWWVRHSIPLRDPDATGGGAINLANIDHIQFYFTYTYVAPGAVATIVVDDIVADNANWGVLEFQTPDDMSCSGLPTLFYCWVGASYSSLYSIDLGAVGSAAVSDDTATNIVALDGSVSETVFGADDHFLIGYVTERGELRVIPANTYAASMIPRTSYAPGCSKRVLVGFKMAPSSEKTWLTSTVANDKFLFRLKPYYGSEVTSILD